MNEIKKKGRGGSTPGSGRKPIYDVPLRHVTVNIKEEVYQCLVKEKNRSEIVNKVLCIYYGVDY